MNEQDDVEHRLARIEQRNLRVEADKAWETSWARRLTIAALTYVVLGAYLTAIGVGRPWLNAVVPTVGYLLSTLALGSVQRWWVQRRVRRAVAPEA